MGASELCLEVVCRFMATSEDNLERLLNQHGLRYAWSGTEPNLTYVVWKQVQSEGEAAAGRVLLADATHAEAVEFAKNLKPGEPGQ